MDSEDIVRLRNAVDERDHIWGAPNAPVTLVEYGNFECIQCGRAFHVIKEAQKLVGINLRFVFRHFPTVHTHPHSLRAAEASEAAGAQGKFWDMHDQLFTHQQALDDHHLSTYANHIGLDIGQFTRDMMGSTFLKQIEAEYQWSLFDEHVTGTPTLYINGERYTSAIDIESLLTRIKLADTEGLIRLPETSRFHGLLKRLHHRADG